MNPRTVCLAGATLLAACSTTPAPVHLDGSQPCGQLDQIAPVGDLHIAYRQYGPKRGAPMVLIPGTGQQLVDWPPALVEGLTARGYRVTLFDVRDTGCSTHMTSAGPPQFGAIIGAMREGKPAPVAYSLETLADDTLGLMQALKIGKAHVVGVSGGAIVAEMFAAKYPDRTLSLAAVAPNSGNPAIPVPADAKRFAGLPPAPAANAPMEQIVAYKVANTKALQSLTHPKADDQLRQIATKDAERNYDPDAASRQSAAALVTPDLRPRLKTITAPTVVIQGDEDPLIPRAMAEEVANSVPGAHLVVVHGMGHDLPEVVTPELVAAIASVAHR